jgi:hypothetical protein
LSLPFSLFIHNKQHNIENDGITEFPRIQNNSPNDFNGTDNGVEDGDLGQEGREVSYEDVVLERLSGEQVKDVARLLVEYVKVTAEGIQDYLMALEKEFRKNQ